jgi:hypothetical protein
MFALEHSKAAYWSDFLIYAAVVGGLTFCISVLAPRADRAAMVALAATGLATWSLVEYAMHRFVLHGIEPFKTWHAKHHERPTALISRPDGAERDAHHLAGVRPGTDFEHALVGRFADSRSHHRLPRLRAVSSRDSSLASERKLVEAAQTLACDPPPSRWRRVLRGDFDTVGSGVPDRAMTRHWHEGIADTFVQSTSTPSSGLIVRSLEASGKVKTHEIRHHSRRDVPGLRTL